MYYKCKYNLQPTHLCCKIGELALPPCVTLKIIKSLWIICIYSLYNQYNHLMFIHKLSFINTQIISNPPIYLVKWVRLKCTLLVPKSNLRFVKKNKSIYILYNQYNKQMFIHKPCIINARVIGNPLIYLVK